MKRIFTIIALIFLCFNSKAQTMSLDTSFGVNGYFELTENSKGFGGSPNLIQNSDGTILLSTQRINGTNDVENIVLKLNANGTIDTNFGTNGIAVINISIDNGVAIKKQSDDKILLYGGQNNSKIIRLLPNGQLDTSFATNGELLLQGYTQDNNTGSNTILLQNDKIIVATILPIRSLIRYDADGKIDVSFGVNGFVKNIQSDYIFLDNQNNIVGIKAINSTYKIEKFNSDGAYLTNFGTNGILNMSSPVPFDVIDLAFFDSQNRILVSATTITSSGNGFQSSIFRINPDGSFDSTFGYNNQTDYGIAAFSEYDNKYLLGGAKINATFDGYENLYLTQIDSNGNLDTSFNGTGQFSESGSIYRAAASVIKLSDGSVLVSGERPNGADVKVFVAKYSSSVSGIVEQENSISFQNPIKDKLVINAKDKIESLELYDSKGRLISKTNSNFLDTSNLTKNIYLVKINFSNGKYQIKKAIKN